VNVDVVVDVGNSFIKWGRCSGGKVTDIATLAPAFPDAWERQLASWTVKKNCQWVVTGSDREHQDRIVRWLAKQNQRVYILDSYSQLPVKLNVKQPEKVGLDRLCNAVGVNSRRSPAAPAIVIDAGTAVTVDLVDEAGVFQGGAILPGLGLMAEILHRRTAALPLLDVGNLKQQLETKAFPGKSTIQAMTIGVEAAFHGGVERIARDYLSKAAHAAGVYIGGGGGALLAKDFSLAECHHWPEMTLEGIRIAAERLG